MGNRMAHKMNAADKHGEAMNRSERSVIVISDIFPPMAAVGVYRTAALCRHLAERGVPVTVITARHWHDVPVDNELLAPIPGNVRIVRTASPHLLSVAVKLVDMVRKRRTGASPPPSSTGACGQGDPRRGTLRTVADWLSWWLHVPDTRIGWVLPALVAGLREVRRTRPTVIYSTAPCWTSHLVGMLLSHCTGLPLVADFQDPWCGSYWRRVPYRAHRWLDQFLERRVVGRASRITCAWDGIRKHLVARYPSRKADIETILNGYDPKEFESLTPVEHDNGRCVFLHAGAFYGPRSPEPLMAAVSQLRAEAPEVVNRIRIVLLGPTQYGGRSLADIAREYGLSDVVTVVPPVPRHEALAWIKGADVSLLFGQSGYEALASVPAKTFDYVAIGSPVLAIGGGEEVCGILRRGGCKLWTATEDVAALADILKSIVTEHASIGLPKSTGDARNALAWHVSVERLARVVRHVGE